MEEDEVDVDGTVERMVKKEILPLKEKETRRRGEIVVAKIVARLRVKKAMAKVEKDEAEEADKDPENSIDDSSDDEKGDLPEVTLKAHSLEPMVTSAAMPTVKIM